MRRSVLNPFWLAGCIVAAIIVLPVAPSFAVENQLAALSPPTDDAGQPSAALFGTAESFSPDIDDFPQWTDMLARAALQEQRVTHVCASAGDVNCVPVEWRELLERMRGLDLSQQIEMVNEALNRIPYVTTEQNWHRPMYWETVFEFLRFGGQCQDYAIAKYELLRAAGLRADLMRVVVLRDTDTGVDHAVLAVYVNGEPMLLDNLRTNIVPARSVSDYRPYYSINENGWWYHFGGQAMIAAR
jgi:predicted transglutaminase-like cysteine proteinase